MEEIIKNYLWISKINNIDNVKLYETCCKIDKKLKELLPPIEVEHIYGCFTSFYHDHYNFLTFNCPEIHKLHTNLIKNLSPLIDPDTRYYMRCWVNLFDQGMNIDWHNHWLPQYKAYHGFYCVNTEGDTNSYTDYKIPGNAEIIRIMSEDGLLVFGKSDGDLHKSSPWQNKDKFRITIAFDVIPEESLNALWPDYNNYSVNNFIPLIKYSDFMDK